LQYMQKHQSQKQDIGVSGAFLVCFGFQKSQYFILIFIQLKFVESIFQIRRSS
jgi:hypothetical protein